MSLDTCCCVVVDAEGRWCSLVWWCCHLRGADWGRSDCAGSAPPFQAATLIAGPDEQRHQTRLLGPLLVGGPCLACDADQEAALAASFINSSLVHKLRKELLN